MTAKTPSFFRVSLSVCVFCIVMISSILTQGQTASKPAAGVPDDWTHRHLVFSNPGTFTDAVKNGTLENWYKITNEPRYQMQQLKRSTLQRNLSGAADFAARTAIVSASAAATEAASKNPKKPTNEPVKKDWSMNLGDVQTGASLTAVVGTTISASTVPSGSNFTLDGVTFTANPPSSESATLTVNSLPTSSSNTVTVTNGSNHFVLTENATAGSATGTFNTLPTADALATVTIGPNTLNLATTATAAAYSLTLDTPGETTTGSITYSYTGTGSTYTFTISNSATTTACALSSGTTYTGTFADSGTPGTAGTHFRTALGDCVTAASLGTSLTVGGTGATATLTDTYLGTLLSVTSNTLNNQTNTPTTGSNGSAASCSAAGNTYTVDYVVSNGATGLASMASSLHSALGLCAGAADVSSTYTTGSTSLGITGSVIGNSFTSSNATVFSFSSVTGNDGTNACTSATAGTFGTGTTVAAVATAISDAVTACTSAIQAGTGINNTTSTNGSGGVTVNAYTPGTTGASGLTLATSGAWASWGSFGGGSDGSNSATTFKYWTGNTYDTQSQLATDIATALGDNTTTITPNFTIGTPSGGNILITYRTAGPSGNSQALTTSTTPDFTALTGGTFSGGVSTTVGAGQYPAKYSFSTTAAGLCSNSSTPDYVVYNTGSPGSSGQANIVAYDNIYSGCSSVSGASTTVPLVYWSYHTGPGVVVTSPVISLDGTKVAFIETPTSTGAATLRILKWSGGEGSDFSSPVAPDHLYTNTTAGAGGNTNWSACTSGSCMISVAFQTQLNPDTNSSPWYDYSSDTIYVGDNNGYLHKFTGVFLGASGEVTTTFPVAVETGQSLTGPVLDNTHSLVFVGSSDGILESVGSSSGTVVRSGAIGIAAIDIADSPTVDPSAGTVYAYVSAHSGGGPSVYQFTYSFASGNTGNAHITASGMGTAGTTVPLYAGDFDNAYYSSANPATPTGHMWVCGNTGGTPTLYALTITTNTLTTTPTTGPTLSNASATSCSPVTEFYNGTSDYIFVSPQTQSGTAAESCTANEGCVISFTVSGTTATHSGSGAFPGGGSAIVVDTQNTTVSGTLQIYFGILGSQGCGGSGGVGTGTGGCAIQASQTAP